MKSKFLTLNKKDFFNGLIIAVGSAILTYLFEVIQLGGFDTFEWKTILSLTTPNHFSVEILGKRLY